MNATTIHLHERSSPVVVLNLKTEDADGNKVPWT